MSNDLSAYGMSSNPYFLPRLPSYDPATETTEPLWVDGFRALKAPGPLHDFFVQRRKAKKPAHVLVRGRSGVGRTAAARRILRQYGISAGAKRMIVPEIRANNSPLSVLQSWLRDLSDALWSSLTDEDKTAFRKVQSATVLTNDTLQDLDWLLRGIDDKFGNGGNAVAFGFCIDDPPEMFDHLTVVEQIFRKANLVVVIVVQTNLDEALDQQPAVAAEPLFGLFRGFEREGRGWIFPRAKLTVEDGYTVASQFWLRARPEIECPIRKDAIEQLWSESALTLAELLPILATALDRKAIKTPPPAWPDNRALEITAEDLCAISEILETHRRYNPRWNGAGNIH